MQPTILVVDDEPGVVQLVSRMLQRAGYSVVPAVGPQEALQAFTHSPDAISLVLTDIRMPEINGLELIARLRRIRPQLPYILMTGFPNDILMENLPRVEGLTLLRKPFTLDALLTLIREALP